MGRFHLFKNCAILIPRLAVSFFTCKCVYLKDHDRAMRSIFLHAFEGSFPSYREHDGSTFARRLLALREESSNFHGLSVASSGSGLSQRDAIVRSCKSPSL